MVDHETDAEYLKGKDLGLIIAKGMAVMYKQNPKNPVDFLAKWLLNYSQVERAEEDRIEAQALVDLQKKQHSDLREKLNTQEMARKEKDDEIAFVKMNFNDSI